MSRASFDEPLCFDRARPSIHSPAMTEISLADVRAAADALRGAIQRTPCLHSRTLSEIAGQGTVALEMLADAPELDALVIPVGGGGLISGCATAARAVKPTLEVFGVQAARYPSMKQALAGEPIRCGNSTLAGGIAVKAPGALTLPIVKRLVREVFLVEEDAIEAAILLYLEVEKTVVEGAGAAALAAVLGNPR